MTGEASSNTTEDSPKPPDAASVTSPQDGYDAQQILALARHPPPGASVYSPSAAPSAAVNPRSCVTCRRRKVRCDKHMPCSNCRRAQIPCIFPAPGRAPRRPRPKDPNAPTKQPSTERELELMKRLRKLEGIVEELSGQIEVESVRHPSSAGGSPEAGHAYLKDEHAIGGRIPHGPGVITKVGGGIVSVPRPASESRSEPDPRGAASPDVHKQFGRLVLNEKGGVRYVSSSLWTSINDELDELRKASQHIDDSDSDESDLDATPESTDHERSLMDHQSFILGYRSADVDLRPLHPLPSQIPFIWQVYQENVDPILKVIHVPTMSRVIKELRQNMDSLTPDLEALMFAIYYASITSLDEEEVKLNFGTDKSVLIQKYRFALEQALAKAEFITNPNFTVVQAFLLLLVLVRRHDDTRFSWTLTGLLIRMAQALGLHRDGTHFPELSPFQIELRRRLFWAVSVLDLRSAEDQGTDLTIVDRTFDTQIPLNINDSDISPDSPCLPEPREGTTDMAFSLVRYEICSLSRRLHTVSSEIAPAYPNEAVKSLEEREELLTKVYQRVQQRLLHNRDHTNPLFWVASNVARIVVAKMTLVIYQPVLFPGPGHEPLAEDVRERLLNAAVDVFEYSHVLNTDPRCKQWRWLFQTWTHWHALAYTLIEVSHRPWGPNAERAWAALNLTFQSPNPELEKLASHHAVWMPLRKLHLKVRKHREAEIARLQADPEAARALDMKDRSQIAPSSFGAIPNSIKSALAFDRWRKLVNLPTPPEEIEAALAAQQRMQQYQQQQVQQQQQQQPQLSDYNNNNNNTSRDQQPTTSLPNTTLGGGTQQHPLQQQPLTAADLMKPEIMEYLDATMAHPTFIGTDFAQLWSTDSADEIARAAMSGGYGSGGGGGAGGGGQTTSVAGYDAGTPAAGTPGMSDLGRITSAFGGMGSGHLSQQQHQRQQSQSQSQGQGQGGLGAGLAPLGTTTSGIDDPSLAAPWLWPISNNMGSPDLLRMPSIGGVSGGTGGGGGGAAGVGADDVDISMDDGFDWKTWQESLGRYELEANGGRAGSTWGPGL